MGTPIANVQNATINGTNYQKSVSVDADNVLRTKKTVAAAVAGQLTTRTDNTTGTLTMNAGHGITTGARLDIYWNVGGVAGHRRGVTVGTVSVNSVPFSLGAGDNLPVNLTNITAMIPTFEDVVITGDNVQYYAFYAQRAPALIVFTDSGGVEKGAEFVSLDGAAAIWYLGNGVTNPLAGDAVTRLYYSHGYTGGSVALQSDVGYN